jgi:hypothetical protein
MWVQIDKNTNMWLNCFVMGHNGVSADNAEIAIFTFLISTKRLTRDSLNFRLF